MPVTYLINQSFFVRNLTIPNLSSVTTGGQAVKERLNAFIAQYEPKCLLSILGYPLYKAFKSESSQRMTDLKDGAEYTDDAGNLRKWQGIVHDTDISLIANYVYFFIQEDSALQTTGNSTSLQKPEAGIAVSPRDKMISAWNFFSSEVNDMILFLWTKKDNSGARVYPEFTLDQLKETQRISRTINFIGF